jgi:hypothetical protein
VAGSNDTCIERWLTPPQPRFRPPTQHTHTATAISPQRKRRDVFLTAGSLGDPKNPNAMYDPPPLPGRSRGDLFPTEIITISDDNPEAVQQAHCQNFPELEAGLLNNRPTDILHVPNNVSCELVQHSNADAIRRICGAFKQYDKVGIDVEWNTSSITGDGSTSKPMCIQLSAMPCDLNGAGTSVSQRTQTAFDACADLTAMYALAETLGITDAGAPFDFPTQGGSKVNLVSSKALKDFQSIPKPLLALCCPTIAVVVQLSKAANGHPGAGPVEVVSMLDKHLIELLTSGTILFVGCNQKGDFTRLIQVYSGLGDGSDRRMLDVGSNQFHGKKDRQSLKSVASDMAKLNIYKPSGLRDYDWSRPKIMQIWLEYAIMDAVVPLLLIFFKEFVTQHMAAPDLVATLWLTLLAQTRYTPETWVYNRCKKDWNHVYRKWCEYIDNKLGARFSTRF